MMLADRHGEQLDDFINRHAREFRKYVDSHNDILDTFKENPEEALKEIEPILYH
jgi:hypothetical protein